jgi:FlaA1/EpsC-like NDP-sugar epimerase
VKNNLLITGAGGSIGFQIVKNFYKKNYNIIAVDKIQNSDLKKSFPKINYFICDLTKEK